MSNHGMAPLAKEDALVQECGHYTLLEAPKPRPSGAEIRRMMTEYYDSLSADFDKVNSEKSFGHYLDAINNLVALELARFSQLERVLSVGSGTGARELAIRVKSERSFQLKCIDQSPKMCAIARANGLEVDCLAVGDVLLEAASFDAVLFLNAFEVLSSDDERIGTLRKISEALRPGGLLLIDAMDIANRKDVWAEKVKEQFFREALQNWGYELGDCFCRRTDQALTVFAHYSSREEMERLFALAQFTVKKLFYLAEDTGAICASGEGHMFIVAEKTAEE